MNIKITPKTLSGSIAAISSKSQAHRLLIAAALSDCKTEIKLNCLSSDILATMDCIGELGGRAISAGAVVEVTSIGKKKHIAPVLACRESGSTARFLLPVAAALYRDVCLIGEGSLLERPFGAICGALRRNGCMVTSDRLPLICEGGLKSGVFEIAGNVSSQYISGLLFALPLLGGTSEIRLTTPLQSEGYVSMTLSVLDKFQIKVNKTDSGFMIEGNQKYISPKTVIAEGDWSNAAFWLCAGALGESITVIGLDSNSLQGDRRILEILKNFGANVACFENEVTVSGGSLKGIEIDAGEIPDLVPIISVLAAGAAGKTLIFNAGRLRYKESDRLESTKSLIVSLGGDAVTEGDSLVINGTGTLAGGSCSSFNDHRIAMSASVASMLCTREVEIADAQCVDKSYPDFYRDFKVLGGAADVIDLG